MQKNFGFSVFKWFAIYLDDEDGYDMKIGIVKTAPQINIKTPDKKF